MTEDYKLKTIPEDFVVEELPSEQPTGKGNYTWFWMTKKDWNTTSVLQTIAQQLRVPLRRFGCAGNKDKRAITKQLCSVERVPFSSLSKIKPNGITLEDAGLSDHPVRRGMLAGNRFRITVRNLDTFNVKSETFVFVNWFGSQRFSTKNVDVGRAIIKRQWRDACTLLELDAGSNPLEAMKKMPLATLQLLVNAYQSFLWHEIVIAFLKEWKKPADTARTIPLPGFNLSDPTVVNDEMTKTITKAVLKKENLSPGDFIIHEFPELSAEGTERNVWVETTITVEEVAGDDLFLSKKKAVISFDLPPGSYATVCIDEFMKNN